MGVLCHEAADLGYKAPLFRARSQAHNVRVSTNEIALAWWRLRVCARACVRHDPRWGQQSIAD
jgi:hypothetical protein